MGIIYLLILMSLVAAAGIWGMLWARARNQFDDLVGPAQIILDDRDSRREVGTPSRGKKKDDLTRCSC